MAVAQVYDGVVQYGFGQQYPKMAPPSSFPNFGYDRRPQMEDHAEPTWPVPRVHPQAQPNSAIDRSRELGGFPNSFSQPDLARYQGNYTYDGSASALRNPVVYSQPAQGPWSSTGQSSEYPEYPTASFMAPMGQRSMPHAHTQSSYVGSSSGTYGDSSLHAGSDAFPKVMNGSSSAIGGPYSHTAETLWPLAPNSLDAFAGIPAPTGQVARLTLTSAADKSKLKSRSSLPPPKQFKCSACDAIFSRNHDLKRHARIHLAVKPFPCGYCDKAFSRKDALKRHVLVKGCGIGNKKPNDSRKRAATLSKLENSEGGNASRAPYDGGPSEPKARDFSGFRDDLHYQGHQQHQTIDASTPRGFSSRMDSSWTSAFPDASDPSSNLSAEYGSSRPGANADRAQASQGGTIPQYGAQHQSQQYASFMGEDALHQSQRQQLAGGLVNAFTSPEDTSASSPAGSQSKHGMGGSMVSHGDALRGEDAEQLPSRPGSTKLLNTVPYGAQAYSLAGGVDASIHANAGLSASGTANNSGNVLGAFEGPNKDRFGSGAYQSAPMMSPSLGGPADQDLGAPHAMSAVKREQQFGSYFGNHTAN